MASNSQTPGNASQSNVFAVNPLVSFVTPGVVGVGFGGIQPPTPFDFFGFYGPYTQEQVAAAQAAAQAALATRANPSGRRPRYIKEFLA